MNFSRRAMITGLFAIATVGLNGPADAKKRKGRKRRARGAAGSVGGQRDTTDGPCPCNGGNVCVGPRGGRYCINSKGNKRYGV